jgi:NitT/TauT family transport system substrate-binding protein
MDRWRSLPCLALIVAVITGCATGPSPQSGPGAARAETTPARAATSPPAPPAAVVSSPSSSLQHLRLASQMIVQDVAMFVGVERGHFQQMGLDVEIVPFANASEIVPALATDQLEAGAVAPNVAMWNAVARGVPIKIVLDRGTFRPGFGNQALLVRKEVWEAGRARTLADLRGLTIALTPPGAPTSSGCILGYGLQRVGQSIDDLTIQPITFGDMLGAMANGSIDAGILIEPFITRLLQQGTAVKMMGLDEMYPNFTIGVVGLSGRLYNDRDTAKRFVRGYIQAIRDYNATLAQPPMSPERERMDQLVANFTKLDIETVREMVPTGLNPNGAPNQESILYCYNYFREQGQIPQPLSDAQMRAVWGLDLVDEVLNEIGRLPEG